MDHKTEEDSHDVSRQLRTKPRGLTREGFDVGGIDSTSNLTQNSDNFTVSFSFTIEIHFDLPAVYSKKSALQFGDLYPIVLLKI